MWLPEKSEEFSEEKIHEYFGIRKNRLEHIRSTAMKAIEKGQAGFLKSQENKRKPRMYEIGQKVWVKNHTASKWAPKFYGPYIVHKIISDSVLWLKDPGTGQLDTVHADYVKPFVTDSPASPRPLQFPADSVDTETELRKTRRKRDNSVPFKYALLGSPDKRPPTEKGDTDHTKSMRVTRPTIAKGTVRKFTEESDTSDSDESDIDDYEWENDEDEPDDDVLADDNSSSEGDETTRPTRDKSSVPSEQAIIPGRGLMRTVADTVSGTVKKFWGPKTSAKSMEVKSPQETRIQPEQPSEPSSSRFSVEFDFVSTPADESETAHPSGFRETTDDEDSNFESSSVSERKQKPKKRLNADDIIVQQAPEVDLPRRLRRRSAKKPSDEK
jgi:hypothetical protein